MDFGDFSDNPFSLETNQPLKPKRKTLVSALKLLVLVAVCLTVILVAGSQSRLWLAHRLTHDFASLSSDEKQSRLTQIAGLGPLAIEPLVQALADDNVDVARTSYDLLRQSQNGWTILSRNEQQHCQMTMVDALKSIAVHIPDDRTGWATSLLQQTILATVERRDEESRELYNDATHAMELLSLSDRAGPSILSDRPLDPLVPRRLTVTSEPLPVSIVNSVDQWTDWPPQRSPSSPDDRASQIVSGQPQHRLDQNEMSSPDAPSVYRSSATKLQAVQPSDTVILRDINQPQETSFQSEDIQSVTHLVDSPMKTFDDKSVIHWLGSPHRRLREQARLELISRGYDGTQLTFATQIASGDVKTRLELIDVIARTETDPRPWLLMMLDDESRDVKLRVISVLSTMKDSGVDQRLRTRLVDEQDRTVAARIRRVLDIR